MGVSRKPTVLSVFTGAGGLDLGLELAGFQTVACIEVDETARATIRANRPPWPFLDPADVTQVVDVLSPQAIGMSRGELDVLAGGPPCQPFSKAAQWSVRGATGLRDPRARCVEAFIRLLDVFLPRVMLIENVPGFAKGRNNAVPLIEQALARINKQFGVQYSLESRVLNASDYGVPQRRERAILIATRDRCSFQWPEPTHAITPVRAWDALANVHERGYPPLTGRWSALLPSIPEGQNYIWHTPHGGGLPLFGYRTRYWSFLLKLAKNQPAWTIAAQPGPATGPFHWDNRPLTMREMLRLQSFPASWKVAGDRRAQILQVGNATPPLLSEVIGRAIGQGIFGLRYDGSPRLYISRKSTIPPPARLQRVPVPYRRLQGNHLAHPGAGRGPRPVSRPEAA